MVKSYSVTEPYKVQFILLVDTTQGEEEKFLIWRRALLLGFDN